MLQSLPGGNRGIREHMGIEEAVGVDGVPAVVAGLMSTIEEVDFVAASTNGDSRGGDSPYGREIAFDLEVLNGTTPHQRSHLLTDRQEHGLRYELQRLQAPQCSPAGRSLHSIHHRADTAKPLGPAPSSHQIWRDTASESIRQSTPENRGSCPAPRWNDES